MSASALEDSTVFGERPCLTVLNKDVICNMFALDKQPFFYFKNFDIIYQINFLLVNAWKNPVVQNSTNKIE